MNILESFPKVRVLVVGDIMLDRYWWGDVNRISPEAPVPIVRMRGSSTAPGGAANVAANIAGLKATPILIGAVGGDREAGELKAAIEIMKIDSSHLITLEHRPTIVKTRIIAHGQQVVRVDQEEFIDLTPGEEATVIFAIESCISNVDAIIVSDYGKGLLSEKTLRTLIEKGNEKSIPVLIDPKGKKYTKYAGATLLTPNRREAAEACSLNEDATDVVQKAGQLLINDMGARNALITQSELGMTFFSSECGPRHIPAAAQQTYDVTGAGDTVIATVGVAHAAGIPLFEASRLANLAAGEVVQEVGTTAITIERLHSVLNEQKSK